VPLSQWLYVKKRTKEQQTWWIASLLVQLITEWSSHSSSISWEELSKVRTYSFDILQLTLYWCDPWNSVIYKIPVDFHELQTPCVVRTHIEHVFTSTQLWSSTTILWTLWHSWTDRQTCGETDRCTDRRTDRQTRLVGAYEGPSFQLGTLSTRIASLLCMMLVNVLT